MLSWYYYGFLILFTASLFTASEIRIISRDENYQVLPVYFMSLTFKVKAAENAYVILLPWSSALSEPSIEIHFGASQNTKTIIRKNRKTQDWVYPTPKILSSQEYHEFQIYWYPDKNITVEQIIGDNSKTILSYNNYPKGLIINHIGFRSKTGQTVEWKYDLTKFRTNDFSILSNFISQQKYLIRIKSYKTISVQFTSSSNNLELLVRSAADNMTMLALKSPTKDLNHEFVYDKYILNKDNGYREFWLEWTSNLENIYIKRATCTKEEIQTFSLKNGNNFYPDYLKFGSIYGTATWDVLPGNIIDIDNNYMKTCDKPFQNILEATLAYRKVIADNYKCINFNLYNLKSNEASIFEYVYYFIRLVMKPETISMDSVACRSTTQEEKTTLKIAATTKPVSVSKAVKTRTSIAYSIVTLKPQVYQFKPVTIQTKQTQKLNTIAIVTIKPQTTLIKQIILQTVKQTMVTQSYVKPTVKVINTVTSKPVVKTATVKVVKTGTVKSANAADNEEDDEE